MRTRLTRYLWESLAGFSLWPVLLFAQSSDLAQNLTDCKNGWETCDRSRLSQSESVDVALADHLRDVAPVDPGDDGLPVQPEGLSIDGARGVAHGEHGEGVSVAGRAVFDIEDEERILDSRPDGERREVDGWRHEGKLWHEGHERHRRHDLTTA